MVRPAVSTYHPGFFYGSAYERYSGIQSTNDYYPFGSALPGRGFDPGSYKFGFNGKEKDNDITGVTGTDYDFGARIYDARVGRFFSNDPLCFMFPGQSNYSFCNDSPLAYGDIEGLFRIKLTENAKQKLAAAGISYNRYKQIVRNLEKVFNDPENSGLIAGIARNTSAKGAILDNTMKEVREQAKWDAGPIIYIATSDDINDFCQSSGSGGDPCWRSRMRSDYPGGFYINADVILALESLDFSKMNDESQSYYLLAFAAITIEEYIHYRDIELNGDITGDGSDPTSPQHAVPGKQGFMSEYNHRPKDVLIPYFGSIPEIGVPEGSKMNWKKHTNESFGRWSIANKDVQHTGYKKYHKNSPLLVN